MSKEKAINTNSNFTERIFGLDLLRSIAIIIVVIGHSSDLLNSTFHFPFRLPDGVDLFFVLSGFLVGGILIKLVNQTQGLNFDGIFYFLRRRWFRTLPNYFLFLIINILLINFGLIKGFLNKYLITYFFFFQNFHKPYDFLFWESWSLAVEEWFYLLFPVLLLIILKFTKIKTEKVIFITILCFLLLPLIYRMIQLKEYADFDLYVRKLVLTRLDTIGFGLLGAYLHYYYSDLWGKTKNLFFVAGLCLFAFLFAANFTDFFWVTFYYSCLGLSILLMLPKLQSIKNENIPFKPFRFLSLISYSMYLIHLPVFQIISRYFSASTSAEALLLYVFFWAITIILSYMVYKYFEKPMTDLREKITLNKKVLR